VWRAEHALNRNPENSGPAHRGALAWVHLGEIERAREWSARALAIDPDDIVAQYNVACVFAIIGDTDDAIGLLQSILPNSSSYQIKWFRNDSDLDRTHTDFRVQQLFDAISD
jgi:adenylate cyclase